MKIEEISQHLKIPPHVTIGLARAGFFGLSSKSGRFKRRALRDFEKYGLQWDPHLAPRSFPDGLVPVVPGWENPPPHTRTEFSVAVERAAAAGQDILWLVNFFFRPNPFYFPADDTVYRLRPLPVKLKEKFEVSCGDASATVYPDPAGRLALIQVLGQREPDGDVMSCIAKARNCIVPVLNWLTMQTDHALPILQQNWVGLPSGDIHFVSPTKSAEVMLDPQGFTDHHPLREVQALYDGYRHAKLPAHPVFGGFSGKKLNTAADELRNSYRNAIAHHRNDKDQSTLLTGTDAASLERLETAMATMRYVVRTKLVGLNELFAAATDLAQGQV